MENSNWITGGKTFRKKFSVEGGFVSACLSITAKGLYETYINGQRVGDFILAPGFTSYDKHHLYQKYDVTELLKDENEMNIFVGDGWYKGRLMWGGNIYGDKTAVIAKLEITYHDKTIIIRTDETWEKGDSPVIFDSIYDGEVYDARFAPTFVGPAFILDAPKDNLVLQDGERITEHEILTPVSHTVTPKGERIIDFGQNLTGYVEITVDSKEGEVVSLSFAEILDKDGNFYTANYRSAKSRYIYICKEGRQTYKPRFTFMGFRYIRVDSAPENTEFKAIAVHSDMKRTGFFECSDRLVNKLFENTIWGQKDNFLDIPTDCPQRDERLGWTGDAQVFAKAASYNFNVNRFFKKWLTDLRLDQFENGNVPAVIPNVLDRNGSEVGGSAAWGDAAVICPWQMYLTYGDIEILRDQFESMRKWVEYSRMTGREHYGDWLGLDAAEGSLKGASDEEYISAAYNAYSTGILIKAGRVLGRDMGEYEKAYAEAVAAFKRNFSPKTQTEYVLALHFNLTDEKAKYAAALADMIAKNDNKLQTGFVGTPYLLHALSDNGYAEIAYTLLLQREYPSWLYPITKGATTIWEHWDGTKPDGSVWSEHMNSYNHYAYGAVVDWLYEVAAGIKIDKNAPGFEHVIINPTADSRLSHLSASIETMHGIVSSKWEIKDGEIFYKIVVPKMATIVIDGKSYEVEKGVHNIKTKFHKNV